MKINDPRITREKVLELYNKEINSFNNGRYKYLRFERLLWEKYNLPGEFPSTIILSASSKQLIEIYNDILNFK